ncbi:hypothetical protein [Streptomyces nogalater]|uniref:Uncharacterized protein n=1 Tax=Streptomyces nogalater TaxID=38314 RepID=A0ABW0W9P2_STRNO
MSDERVGGLCRAGSPEAARRDGLASLWPLPLFFGGLRALIVEVGAVVAIVTRRRWTVVRRAGDRRGR